VLWQVGDVTVWTAVARWLGQLHRSLSRAHIDEVPVLELDAASFASWRALAAEARVPELVLDAHRRAAELLLALPSTTIHGDLYPSNVLVDPGPPVTVWPVDWELIGRGPAVLDLAAITSGAWNADERAAMVDAYAEAGAPGMRRDLDAALDAARLHLCVQWLGVPPEWQTPPEHAHDWMSEAFELAARV
jgi:Ser/Thr protein kinase RdoA (MazF antagonist)